MKRYQIIPQTGNTRSSKSLVAAMSVARHKCIDDQVSVRVRDTQKEVDTHRYEPDGQTARLLTLNDKGEMRTNWRSGRSEDSAVPVEAKQSESDGLTPPYARLYRLIPDGPASWEKICEGRAVLTTKAHRLCADLCVDVRVLDTETGKYTHRYEWGAQVIRCFKYDAAGQEYLYERGAAQETPPLAQALPGIDRKVADQVLHARGELNDLIRDLNPTKIIREFLSGLVAGWLIANRETPDSFLTELRRKHSELVKNEDVAHFVAAVKARKEES